MSKYANMLLIKIIYGNNLKSEIGINAELIIIHILAVPVFFQKLI